MAPDDPAYAGAFGERVAATYDDDPASSSAAVVDPIVDRLVALAAGGRALELAIGTGRIAVPLARRGVPVAGIDDSPAMLSRLHAKPGAEGIETVLGDMATARVDGAFALVYLVYNTLLNLVTQDAQVACVENAARHLAPGGCFVVEALVPDLQRLPPGQRILPFHAGPDGFAFDVYEVATQGLTSQHFALRDGRLEPFPVACRYVWPAELDLMARIAGLRLEARHGGWRGEPFDDLSRTHVSVYRRP